MGHPAAHPQGGGGHSLPGVHNPSAGHNAIHASLSGIGRIALHDPVRQTSSPPPLQGSAPRSGSSAARRGHGRQGVFPVKRNVAFRSTDGFKTSDSYNQHQQQLYEATQQSQKMHGAAADIAWGNWPHTPRQTGNWAAADLPRSPVPANQRCPDPIGLQSQTPGANPGLQFCETWREGDPRAYAVESPLPPVEFLNGGGAPQVSRPARKRQPLMHSTSAHEENSNQLVPWGDEDGRQSRASLGAIQPDGRAQVLEQWCSDPNNGHGHGPSNEFGQTQGTGRRNSMSQIQKKRQDSKAQQQLFRQNLSQMTDAPGATLCVNQSYIKGLGVDGQKLEWSTLSSKSKHALWQWVIGQLGGRHCLMILEHDVAIDFFISPLDSDEVIMSDLKGGVVLNALSGLQADAGAHSGEHSGAQEAKGLSGGWLYTAVFAKSPVRVLEDAFEAALGDAAETWKERPNGLSVQQVNLSLKRQAMRAQSLGLQSMANLQRGASSGPRSSEEYLRVQIWLELLRLHVEGALGSAPPPPPPQAVTVETLDTPCAGGKVAAAGARAIIHFWDDKSVLHELGKREADREAESKKMTLDGLRIQNRSIEAYLMRLVRQRDKLKKIAGLAEECDSYFILGLDGPEATEDEVKKAYRSLAKKEHPDKAGADNRGRFQEIQQAYAAVLRQRRVSTDGELSTTGATASSKRSDSKDMQGGGGAVGSTIGPIASEAVGHAETARDSADHATSSAYQTFQLGSIGAQIRANPKRGALRELRDLSAQGVAHLRGAAVYLRSVRESACGVSRCAKNALEKYGEFADLAIAGAGLNERADLVHEAGQTSLSAAEHLEKTSEVSELALQQVARTSEQHSRAPSDSGVMQSIRLLGDSLARGAVAARCAADEAISTATKALELSCSIVALDCEWRREHEQAAKNASRDSPRVAKDASSDRVDGQEGKDSDGNIKSPAEKKDEEKGGDSDSEQNGRRTADGKRRDGAKGMDKRMSDIERIKKQHINLRVKNLQCLGSLNEEVLQLQEQLRGLFKKGDGGLLPAISISQKDGVFELVKQLLNAAFVEAGKLVSDASVPVKTVLEKAFSFALALEHTKEVALSAEVRTHVLKLAALVDLDLLCQIIDGPFRDRLLGLDTSRRPIAAQTMASGFGVRSSTSHERGNRQSVRPGVRGRVNDSSLIRTTSESLTSWDDAVHLFCERLLNCLDKPLAAASGDIKPAP